jgi:hypothetical protein
MRFSERIPFVKRRISVLSSWLLGSLFIIPDVQTLDTMQALCLPLGASISLLVMFFFFDSMQMLFAICTASKSRALIKEQSSPLHASLHTPEI